MKFSKLKITKRYGGGGSGPMTTTQAIPDWAQPYIQKAMGAAQDAYGGGSLSKVAGTSALQGQAFTGGANAISASTGQGMDALAAQQARLKAATTSGGYDPTALKAAAIQEAGIATSALGGQYGASGTLGSARQAVQQGALDASTAAKFATIDQGAAQQAFANRMAAEQGLGSSIGAQTGLATGAASSLANLGGQQRTVEQQQQDAQWQGLQRYASTVYGTPARQSASATPGGK